MSFRMSPDSCALQESGPIKEHLLEEAYLKRQRNKDDLQGVVDSTGIPDLDGAAGGGEDQSDEDLAGGASDEEEGDGAGPSTSEPSSAKRSLFEEAGYRELDGEQLSAFNMNDETEEGYNEETGEIMRRRDDEDDDPWLQSLQHEVVRVRRRYANLCIAFYAPQVSQPQRLRFPCRQRGNCCSGCLAGMTLAGIASLASKQYRTYVHCNAARDIGMGKSHASVTLHTSCTLCATAAQCAP